MSWGRIGGIMLDNWIDLFVFRDLFTKREKWFLIIFNLIIGIILIMGNILLLGLKLFIGFLNLLSGSGEK